ncbi:MAG TPA: Bax inhibitor-1/YccA family protein [bacterium]|nr:Bax inhibitor-1/YccA family protein [bacterium]
MEMFGNRGSGGYGVKSAAMAGVEERMAFLRKVYSLLTLSLLTAAVGAYFGRMFVSPGLMMVLFIAEFALIFVAMAVRHKPGWNVAALFAFAGVSGITLGPVMLVYNAAVIQEALVLTVLIFAGLTMYVMTSKKDFSFLSGFLFTGLIIVIAGSLLNAFFFHSPAGDFILAAGGVILFSGFILYDTSNILRRYDVQDYTAATLALYLDLLNLFLFLLRLLSNRD